MTSPKDTAHNLYGQKMRVRACGILIQKDKLLLACHQGLSPTNEFWMPPGGGVEFGEPLHKAVCREFVEETNLVVEPGPLLTVYEYIEPPLHALEFFFKVKLISGNLLAGTDPELPAARQLLKEVKFLALEDIKEMPAASVHPILHSLKSFNDLITIAEVFYPAGK